MSKIGRKLKRTGPITTIIFLILVISGLSFVLNLLGVRGYTTEAGTLETSIVTINNVISKDGIKYILNNTIVNFQMLQPLVYLIISLIAVSILETSGLLKHLLIPFGKMKYRYITFLTLLLGIISNFIGDYSYVLLLPLVASVYKYLGRDSSLGVITMFIGITIGYSSGIFVNYQDYLLGIMTEGAALGVDASFEYSVWSNLYIMIVGMIVISILGTILIEKKIAKQYKRCEYSDNLVCSRKAFIPTLIIAFILIGFFTYAVIPGLPLSGMLLKSNSTYYIDSLLGDGAPLSNSLLLLILGIILICSFVYGKLSRNIKNNDYTYCMTKAFNNTGYIFVLMFFASVLLGILDWTNINTVFATNVIDFIGSLQFSGILLVFIVFMAIVLISILIPSSLTKWSLASPVLVPLLMRSNISPAFTQYIFSAADAVGKCLSPIYIYLIIMIGFLYKDDKNNDNSIFGTMKLMMPVLWLLMLALLVIVLGWYLIGFPIGISTNITM